MRAAFFDFVLFIFATAQHFRSTSLDF